MRQDCWCGKTLNKDKKCDGSHDLTEEQYKIMIERVNKRRKNEKKKQTSTD